MSNEDAHKLVSDVMAGRISRREFVLKALALGMSVSGITAALASLSTPADAQTSGTYGLLVSSSSNRSTPTPLAGKTVSGNIYAFTSPTPGSTGCASTSTTPT